MEKYTEAESRAAELEEKRRTEERAPPRPNRPAPAETSQSKLFLFQFLDLVDRYWNGSKSLHKNVKFKGKVFFFGGGGGGGHWTLLDLYKPGHKVTRLFHAQLS